MQWKQTSISSEPFRLSVTNNPLVVACHMQAKTCNGYLSTTYEMITKMIPLDQLAAYYFHKISLPAISFSLPHDAMHKRSLLSPCVRPSVCHSWDIVKLLSGPVAPSFLFSNPGTGTQFQGEPFQRCTKYMEVGKFCNFRLKLPLFISETVWHRPTVAMEC